MVDEQQKPVTSASIPALFICLQQTCSTPCACGSLCAHREPHAQGVLHVCCKQMNKAGMDALVTGFCCSSTMTITNLLERHGPVDLLAHHIVNLLVHM